MNPPGLDRPPRRDRRWRRGNAFTLCPLGASNARCSSFGLVFGVVSLFEAYRTEVERKSEVERKTGFPLASGRRTLLFPSCNTLCSAQSSWLRRPCLSWPWAHPAPKASRSRYSKPLCPPVGMKAGSAPRRFTIWTAMGPAKSSPLATAPFMYGMPGAP